MSAEKGSQSKKWHPVTSKVVNRIPPSGIRKYFDMLATMDDVITLGVGEPDFATPWHISEAAVKSLEKGYTMYTSNSGMPELREELARYMEANIGLKYDPVSEILITVGVSEGLDLVMRAILNPGDEVVVPEPCYVSYAACVTLAGGTPIMVVTSAENDFEVSAQIIEAAVTPRTRAILIGYPSNPTGAVLSRRQLEEIADVARRHDLIVVSDEIYAKLVYGVEHPYIASLPGMRERTVFLGGFSKAYAMTGWRVAYAAGHHQIIAAMTKIHQYTMLCAPIMSQIAAIEALRTGDDSAAKMLEEYNRRRIVIVKGFNEIGMPCFNPRGAFYAFPSIKHTGMTSEEFAEKLLMEEKVACVPGTAFGQCGEGHLRCCYATSMDNIEIALERIGNFMSRYGK
jgi:aminotransferase